MTRARDAIERAYRGSSSGDDVDDEDEDDDAMPVFTREQIAAKEKELEDIPNFLKNMVTQNMTELATSLLEDEWIDARKEKREKIRGGGGLFGLFGGGGGGDEGGDRDNEKGEIGGDGERMDLGGVRGTFDRMFSSVGANGTSSPYGMPGMPRSEVDFMMNTLYPKTTRKEGDAPDRKAVDTFLNDVVGPTKAFVPNSDPISVSGGWVSPRELSARSCLNRLDHPGKTHASDRSDRRSILASWWGGWWWWGGGA